MIRKSDWDFQLAQFLSEAEKRRFIWGKNDCALFVCEAIERMTGVDPAADWRGQYDSEEGALQRLREQSGEQYFPLEAICVQIAEKFQIEEVPPQLAHRGDPVWLRLPENPFGGILGLLDLDARQAVFIRPPRGIQRVPREEIDRAWHIPFIQNESA